MIRLTITSLIALYIIFSVIITIIIWVIFGYRELKKFTPKDIDFIWKCSVCYNTYLDSKHEDISICPLCGSYNKREKGVRG